MSTTESDWGLKSGMTLGHYVLMDKIACGGMGVIFKAFEPALERFVAIKVLHQELAAFPDRVEHFHAEAQAVAALQHPNIVPIHYIGQAGPIPFFSMAFIDGLTLDDWIENGKTLQVDEALWFMEQAISALEYAQRFKLIHQDIKPSNFLVDAEPRVLLTDFGLAKHIGMEDSEDVFGTPFYVAPEQLLHLPTDHRTDIYSLGATLFHLVAGVPPFNGESVEEISERHLKGSFPIQLGLQQGVYEPLLGCIHKMMERHPARRFQSYQELREALSDLDSFIYDPEDSAVEAPLLAVSLAPEAPPAPPIPEAVSAALEDLLRKENHDWLKSKPNIDFRTNKAQIQNAIQFPIQHLTLDKIGRSCKELTDHSNADEDDLIHAATQSPTIQHLLLTVARLHKPEGVIQTAQEAIHVLDLKRARNLALAGFLIGHEWIPSHHFNWSSLWQHQLTVGILAEDLILSLGIKTTGREFATGLFHDFGIFLLGELYPLSYFGTLRRSIEEQRPLLECEADIFGVTHPEVSSFWFQKHQLPKEIIEAIALHESEETNPKQTPLLLALRVADIFSQQFDLGFEASKIKLSPSWRDSSEIDLLWKQKRVKHHSFELFSDLFESKWKYTPSLILNKN